MDDRVMPASKQPVKKFDHAALQPILGYGRQNIAPQDIEAVIAVLRSDYLTQGPVVDQFEAAIAEYVGARFAVAVSSGTAALHVACLAAGLRGGARAVTQAVTFVATANASVACGAAVVAVDIDPQTLGLEGRGLRSALAQNPDVSVVLPVHMGGLSADPMATAAASSGRLVIEDACHALGGREPDGARVGSCRHSAMACFSFHPVKSITTGEGGAVTTNDPELARRLRMLRNHGIEREAAQLSARDQGFDHGKLNPWYYEQQVLGFNYRITDLQAALGLSQLRRIEQFIERRRELTRIYDESFAGLPALRPLQATADARARSAHHLYIVDIDYSMIARSRRSVMADLKQRGIGTQVHYIPLYRQPFHRGLGRPQDFPSAERYYGGCLSLPLHAALTDADAQRVVSAVREAVSC
jgi:UDP-4-amino-4,6-dideoxy-N-acetyl-beta-L-altrosamine transaminase